MKPLFPFLVTCHQYPPAGTWAYYNENLLAVPLEALTLTIYY